MNNIHDISIRSLHEMYATKQYSVLEFVQDRLEYIKTTNPALNSFVFLDEQTALEKASRVDEMFGRSEKTSILAGIPAGVKDLYSMEGVHTEACSHVLKGYKAPYTATAVAKLQNNNAIILGKTNMDEFACGASNEYSTYGPVSNPWDESRVSGGSSGGSAAAVASGQVLFALGTDTGGSVRQPASFCGISGLKPTYGRISRFGVLAMSSSLDTVGIFARSAEDIAYVLEHIAGQDPRDATSSPLSVPSYSGELCKDIRGMKIGIPKDFFVEGLDKGVEEQILNGIKTLEKMGASIREVSLPHAKYAVAVYYIIVPCELSANLARYDGIRFGAGLASEKEADDLIDYYFKVRDRGFGDEIKRRIMIGTYCLSAGYLDAYFKKALKVRTLIIRDFEDAFASVDALVGPVAPTVAFKKGERKDDPLAMYLADMFTIPASVAGLSAISVPCGFSEGLPVGMQIIGPQFGETRILQIADAYQKETDWHRKTPQ